MDIKYTIEILTKDIQDIEKLVGKLQNSKDASAIELDLAMSKLRNVYEILSMIKSDKLNELIGEAPERKPEPQAEPVTKVEPESEPETQIEFEPEPESEPETQLEFQSEPEPEPESAAQPEPVPPSVISSDKSETGSPENSTSGEDDSTILGEKFQTESSINENLAETRSENLDSKLMGQAIDNIRRNIGINDRFLIIRELFDGNSDGYSMLITRLDTAESYLNATELLEEQFAGSMEHEGVEILAGLVKRRYLR